MNDEITSRDPTTPKRLTASVKSLAHRLGIQAAQMGTHATPAQVQALGELAGAILRDLSALNDHNDNNEEES